MKNIKKLILISISLFSISICYWIDGWNIWEDSVYKFPFTHDIGTPTTDIQDRVDINESNDSIMIRLLEVFWLNRDAFFWDHKFIYYLRAILNMALWLLSLIALIIVIYTFYTMFFSDSDKNIEKAKWNLVGIFIALGAIWLARLIVSFIFRWYQSNWKSKEHNIETGKVSIMNNIDNTPIYLTI